MVPVVPGGSIEPEEPTRPPHAHQELAGHGLHERACKWASGLFCRHLLQDDLVEREVCPELLECSILVLKLPEPANLRDRHLAIPFAPHIVGRFTNPEVRGTSAMGAPASICRSAVAICSSENLRYFMAALLGWRAAGYCIFPVWAGLLFREDVSCQAVIPQMRKQNKGRIVSISSVAGMRMTFLGGPEYPASKYGLQGLVQHLAWEPADSCDYVGCAQRQHLVDDCQSGIRRSQSALDYHADRSSDAGQYCQRPLCSVVALHDCLRIE